MLKNDRVSRIRGENKQLKKMIKQIFDTIIVEIEQPFVDVNYISEKTNQILKHCQMISHNNEILDKLELKNKK